jgi:hypothetical protein
MPKEVVLMRHLQDEDNLLVGGNDLGLIEAELQKPGILPLKFL